MLLSDFNANPLYDYSWHITTTSQLLQVHFYVKAWMIKQRRFILVLFIMRWVINTWSLLCLRFNNTLPLVYLPLTSFLVKVSIAQEWTLTFNVVLGEGVHSAGITTVITHSRPYYNTCSCVIFWSDKKTRMWGGWIYVWNIRLPPRKISFVTS